MAENKNIVLTGMPGSGKTTVGQKLADKLTGYDFIDTDKKIEQENGLSVTEIFNSYGEKYFRRLENEKIKQIAQTRNQIISLGGGAFENKESRKVLLKNAVVIYLKTTPYAIIRRIQAQTHRPLLEGAVLNKRITEILKEREKNYAKAHYTVDTDDKTAYDVVEEILKIYRVK
ncbi:MAG: shikimate kinase [Heliobacteriaceae bacterium]|jgi:shikimate kinase|nr:shikimate kinase [Heliobacteriaceae bacterium]